MATISIPGNTIESALGIGAFQGVGVAFKNVKSSVERLSGALKSLKDKIDIASVAANVDTSYEQAKQAQERESEKQSTLSLAYEKLDTLVSDVSVVDDKAASKIHRRMDDFYNRYSYLKPDCEKTGKERFVDGCMDALGKLKDFNIGEAIENIVHNICDWCKEHLKEILIGLAFIVVGALITVFTAGTGTAFWTAAFWAAFGAELVKGLAKAACAAALSGIMRAGITYYKYRKSGLSKEQALRNAGKAFGDGIADGFMKGGIAYAASAGIIGAVGENAIAGHSLLGSVGKGALLNAGINAITSPITTTISYLFENGTLNGSSGIILQNALRDVLLGGISGGITGGLSWSKTMAENNSYVENYKKATMESLKAQMKNNITGTNVKNNIVYNASENIKDITAFSNFLKTTSGYTHSVQRVSSLPKGLISMLKIKLGII